jgi:tetratricopeptide (TPR) repeat protein
MLAAAAIFLVAARAQDLEKQSRRSSRYELAGRIRPEARAAVSLYGAAAPFASFTRSDGKGRFHFRRLPAGSYTLAIYIAGQGEARRTVDVGPSAADGKGRVTITLDLTDPGLFAAEAVRRRKLVSARELTIPDRARREYSEAQKKLSHRDVPGAVQHLKRAVEIAPQFAAAWNNLGTIAYQSGDYKLAESNFRRALDQDPAAFEPLVNLGGALLSLNKLREALECNLRAVEIRPNDALANSQLGITYFQLGDLDRAMQYLTIAKRIDPGHFSHPQLVLAQIHLRRREPRAAADEFQDFLEQHPDWPEAARMREAIAKLRK